MQKSRDNFDKFHLSSVAFFLPLIQFFASAKNGITHIVRVAVALLRHASLSFASIPARTAIFFLKVRNPVQKSRDNFDKFHLSSVASFLPFRNLRNADKSINTAKGEKMKKCFAVFLLLFTATIECAANDNVRSASEIKYFGQYVSYTTPQGVSQKALGEIIALKDNEIIFYAHKYYEKYLFPPEIYAGRERDRITQNDP